MFYINGRFLTQKATGVHRYAFEICNKLHEMHCDFKVVAPRHILPDYDFQFPIEHVGFMPSHLWEQCELPFYLHRKGNPLLVSFSGCGPLCYNRQIITIHDVSHERFPHWFSRNYCRFYGYMFPRIARKAKAVLTVSEFSKQEIIDTLHIDADKIHVVHSNVPFHTLPVPKDSDECNDKSGEKYIISVSSMDPRKNFVRLVNAFSKMEDSDIKLYIVGMPFKAFNTPDLQQLASRNVVLPGYIDDSQLKAMYSRALFSVYPSLYEGFGLPPLESMTFGCPAIVSNIPALREISGDAALYIDPESETDMTEKMNLLASSPVLRTELREKGYRQIQRYSWDKSAKQVLDIVNRFI
jgi:glycosyltransferase involved in cell wall biosynthesis